MTNIYDSLGISGGLNISANSTTDAIYISQLGTGNAVLIEDSANPDTTPFIINSGGSVNIGRIEYLTTSGGTQPKLQVNNSTSQIPSSGLPFTTNFIVQGFNNNNVGFFTTDINTSQLYFGTPSNVYGAKLSWRYTGGTFDLSTQTTGGTITFGTDQGIERMRIQSDGNVGIGTTAATSTLTVNGSLSATTLYGDGTNLTGISGISPTLYLLESYANETYTLPGSFTEDPCRYSIVNNTVNVPSGWFNTSTYRFTPQRSGYWEITASYDVYRNTEASLAIKKNTDIVAAAGSFDAVAQQITKIVYLNGSTDYISIINVGGASLSRAQYDSRSWFQARWVG